MNLPSQTTMYKLSVIVILSYLAAVSAYEIFQDAEGQKYFLVPLQSLHRQRRESSIGIANGKPGAQISASHQGPILNSNGHRLDGGAFVSKQFRPSGPATVGGQLGYSHAPSGSNLNLGAQHTQRLGTNVRATGTANLWQHGPHSLNAVGTYDRRFGGVGGTGSPNFYTGLEYKMKYHY